MKKLLKPSTFVVVTFFDHCLVPGGVAAPVPITLSGWVVEDKADYIVIAGWVADKELSGHNTDTYTLVKHKGMKIKKVKAPK